MQKNYLRLNFPGCSHVGQGAIEVLGEEAASRGSSAMLVTGRTALKKAGITDRLVGLLEDAGLSVAVFDRVPPEPEIDIVDELRRAIRSEGCDIVVEAGGGSVMDVGKAAAALAREKLKTRKYHTGEPVTTEGLPHIAVATTSGTGSEVTRVSVLIDHSRDVKKSMRTPGIMPDVSITDPELTVSCPPSVTAASGMDAYVQAVESYFSRHAIPVTEALSLHAAGLIVRNLRRVWEDGEDIEARSAVAQGSYMAGLALGSARLGAVHGLAHPIGLLYDLPHGVVCGMLMPAVLRLNRQSVPDKYDALRQELGGDPVRVTNALLRDTEVPRSLSSYPDDDGEELIINYALGSGSSKANPVPVTREYVREVLTELTETDEPPEAEPGGDEDVLE